jgi:quinol monooxygenase YgiN
MPALPWKSFGAVDPNHKYIVMASRLPLGRYRDVPAFLRASMDIRRQLRKADGLLGYGLDAKLVQRTFWTLSVWRDADALDAFARTDPHAARVRQVRPLMNTTTFVTWATTGDQLPVTWDQARSRVSEAA